MPQEKTVLATVCFVTRDRRVLMIHKQDWHGIGEEVWNGVGGKAELDEDPTENCIRETFEETGLRISNPRLRCIQVGNSRIGKEKWVIFTYLANKFELYVKESGEGEVKWVNFEDIPKLNIPPNLRLIFSRIFDEDEPLFLLKYIYSQGKIIHHRITNL
ncbi:MAG: NUDIX domain-containing protein [Candidatus Bathyarchaeota archaeon]|nr:NUDIX domain-containing protein [Candidatus Bathyarchaeota archaeon]MDH5688206.1 NUDIX domain-containing protein [Candidatus Bathyarchaeota archaeon]